MAAFIAAQRTGHHIPCAVSCRALGVSPSWYYKWAGGELPPRAVRRQRLKAEVGLLFAGHEGKCGSPRVTADLKDAGWKVSENTVAELMRELGLAARRKKRRKATTRLSTCWPPTLCPRRRGEVRHAPAPADRPRSRRDPGHLP